MQFKIRFPVKVPKRQFKVNKSFKTRSKITKRTIEISEAFGIGVEDEKEFVIFKDFVVDVNPSDLVYIVGDSGGGKSVLLKELKVKLSKHKEFGKVMAAHEVKLDDQQILIEGIGKDTNSAVNILSQAGLNEAFLMLRRYNELSDGQKYRYIISKMIDSETDTWVFDEFLATLDRITAKVVAYCIQKTARKLGKTVIVATTHKDLFEDLNPSIYIEKGFGDFVKVERFQYQHRFCSLLNEIRIEKGTIEDYKKLESFHYKGESRFVRRALFRATLTGEVIGTIVYVSVHPNLRARWQCLPQVKGRPLKEIDNLFLRIARVVVHPKFRTIGLGVKLVKDTLPLVNRAYVETLAVMARYNPFFEHAGLLKVPTSLAPEFEKAFRILESFGFNLELLSSKKYNLNILERLSGEDLGKVEDLVLKTFMQKKFNFDLTLKERIIAREKEAIAEALTKRPLKTEYLIWKDPDPKYAHLPNPTLRFRAEPIDSRKPSMHSNDVLTARSEPTPILP